MLSSADLVTIWEAGEHRHDADRALIVLSRAHPEMSWADLATMPLGRRDMLLLGVRRGLLGSRLDIGVRCTKCSEPLEFQATVDELTSAGVADAGSTRMTADGFDILARPICSRDLVGLRLGQTLVQARTLLVEACVIEAKDPAGRVVPPSALTKGAVAALSEALTAADPMADIEFELDCPACAHRWILVFDIVPYLWRELSTIAQTLLDDVYDLARHVSWPEAEILGLSASRRAYYLGRARA